MAYDTIMVFKDRFKNHILPEQIHILNVAFLVPEMRREYGGCAGNIAYNLHLLGGQPLIMATVGDDFAPYSTRLQNLGLAQTHIRQVPDSFTGQAFITTDLDDNQITAFHPGAMGHSHLNSVAMAQLEFADQNIPFVFDPGQGMPMFSGPELLRMVEQATYVTVNDYEAKLLQDKTGKTLKQIADRVKALIITLGSDGSLIHAGGKEYAIPTPKPAAIVDPTGCGDAYRAGLLYGIQAGWDWETAGRLASLMGALKIASRGGQNHRYTRAELAALYQHHFGSRITL